MASQYYNFLLGVSALSTSDVWAVGYYESASDLQSRTLIEHWNGTSWNVVTSPNLKVDVNRLTGVVAISANNVWAVGYSLNNRSQYSQNLIEHWNGTSWSIMPSPNVPSSVNQLNAVSAVSASDIWAVGYSNNRGAGTGYQTLTEHWNGTSWSIVSSPNVGSFSNFLSGVAVVSTGDAWAVGTYSNSYGGPTLSLTEHWNGTSWSAVTSPNVGLLLGVTAISTSDVWAVGNDSNGTLIEQWNGTSWSVVTSPTVSGVLVGVTAISTSDIWAVGYSYSSSGVYQTLIEQWNGTSWSVVSSPNGGSNYILLFGVAALSTGDVWAVGYYYGSGSPATQQTLIEFYC